MSNILYIAMLSSSGSVVQCKKEGGGVCVHYVTDDQRKFIVWLYI